MLRIAIITALLLSVAGLSEVTVYLANTLVPTDGLYKKELEGVIISSAPSYPYGNWAWYFAQQFEIQNRDFYTSVA